MQVLVYHIHWHQESYVVSISWKFIKYFLYVPHDVNYLERFKKDIIFFCLEMLLIYVWLLRSFSLTWPQCHYQTCQKEQQFPNTFNTHLNFFTVSIIFIHFICLNQELNKVHTLYLVVMASEIIIVSFLFLFWKQVKTPRN